VEIPDSLPPLLVSDVPGPGSRQLAARLRRVESRNVTCLEPTPPIFWARAHGANVWDVDDNRYLDLTAAFGVVLCGHGHPEIIGALNDQTEALIHGMGDVHPTRVRLELLEALAARFPRGAAASSAVPSVRAVLGCSGSDAVEVALKTALLRSGRAGVVAFEGAYHGLALGVLDATWRRDFRDPFAARLPGCTVFASFGDLEDTQRVADSSPVPIGAVLLEPVQGRAGQRVPPAGFLSGLRALCDDRDWLLIADEIYTGLGRTGRLWACDHEQVVPDLLCTGKGLAAGMPLSACIGSADVMDAWPASTGEALHTQTFLGHPLGCAAALAALRILDEQKLPTRAAETGALALERLRAGLSGQSQVVEVRGSGLMIGIELTSGDRARAVVQAALERGVILLPCGTDGRVVSITPPLSISPLALLPALDDLIALIAETVA
jgi:4-aminobutyrate aminotransferase/(S)-3-amino-2-methylpropionate transaminase